ncbi:MAG: hypothetical protein OXN88_08490 [Chloroflexota bacterium]|nr:hypothetical protein [Chloroflexota bacterium]
MAENTIALVSFLLTLMVFSYILGDIPLVSVLYRSAVFIFAGMTAAFTLVVTYEGLILPYLQDIQDRSTSWTTLGHSADIYIFGTALLFGLLLLLKPFHALSWLTNSVLAVVIVVAASVAVVGALSGTLFPLLQATAALPAGITQDFSAMMDRLLIFVGTMTALFYFHYQLRPNRDGLAQGSRLGQGFRHIGKAFIVTTLGAIYASTILTCLTILTERISFLFQFGA